LFGLGAFVVAQLLAAIILGLTMGLAGAGDDWIEGVFGQFAWVLLSDTLVLTAVWIFLKRRKLSIKFLGLGRSPVWRDLGLAVLAYVIYFGCLIAAMLILGATTPIDLDQKQELGFDNVFSPIEKLMALISLVLLPPLVEEIVFRGFMFTGLRTRLSFAWTTAVTSAVFAAPHLLASSQGLHWAAGVDTFILSIVLCYLREKTGALWAPIFVHTIKNAVAFILLLTAPASVIYWL
jgi:hypothetical protein